MHGGQVVLDIQPDDVRARHHDRARGAVVEPQHAVDHGLLARVEHAFGRALADHGAHFALGHAAVAGAANAEHGQNGAGRHIEQADQGPRHQRQPAHRPGDETGHALGVTQGDVLGHQFADDEREIGGQRHDHAERDAVGIAAVDAQALQPLRKRRRQRGAAERAGQDADQGDADLHRGQKAPRIFRQLQRPAGAAVARMLQRLQARAPRRHHGHFGQGQQPVEHNQADNNQNFNDYHPGDPVPSLAATVSC